MVTDLNNDKNRKFKETKNGYVFTAIVDYANDKNLTKQKIYLDKDAILTKVEVLDKSGKVVMKLQVKDIDMNAKFSSNYFNVDKKYYETKKDTDKTEKEAKTTSVSEASVYPMYVPADTYLSSQDVVKTDDGERVIMTFAGETPFTLVQGDSSATETGYIYGDPYIVLDTVGAITDESVMWVSNNIEYYVASDVMDTNELLTVAESISVKAVSK